MNVEINVSGLIKSHRRDEGLSLLGRKLGRMDGGGYAARHDEPEKACVDRALGIIRGLFPGQRLDSAESAFTQRALVFVDGQPYATLIPPLEARTFIPTSVKGNPGDTNYLWRKYTRTGIARLLAPGAALDLPRSNFYVEEITQRFYPIGVQIIYDYFELLAIGAALANGQPVDLVGEQLRAAMEAIEKKLDLIAAFGTASPGALGIELDGDVGLTGLLNNGSATAYTVPAGAGGGTAWSAKTPDEVLADLNGIVGGQVATTFKVHRPDTIIVPISQFETQLQRRMSDVSGETILSFFKRTRREGGQAIEVLSWDYAAGIGAGGADVMVAYKREPRMLEHILAMDATPLPATTQGLETKQQVIAKTAGLVLRYPLSVSITSGGTI